LIYRTMNLKGRTPNSFVHHKELPPVIVPIVNRQ